MQNILSLSVFPEIFPKPTVAMHVMVKYKAKKYSIQQKQKILFQLVTFIHDT